MATKRVRSVNPEVEELRLRLEEAEQTLQAIRSGEVDSLVVEGPNGPMVYALEGASNSYRVLVEAMNEGAATLAADGTILYCNGRFARILGAPLNQLMGSSIYDSTPAAGRAALEALLQDVGTGSMTGEVVFRAKSGAELPAHLSISTIDDGGRRVLCVVATDLTDQKQELDKIVSSMVDSVIVFDADRRIARANAAAIDAMGFNPVGLSRVEVERRLAFSSPDGRVMLSEEQPSARALRGETVTDLPVVVAREGGRFEFTVSCSPLRAGNRIVGAVSVWHDLTAFLRAQESLRESEARFRSVLENSRDVIYRVNVQTGRFDYISPSAEKVVGYSADELKAQDAEGALAMIHPDHVLLFKAAQILADETGEAQAEYRQRTKGGNWRWLSNRMSVVRDDKGRPLYRHGNIRDITDRKRAEEALRAERSLLAATIDLAPIGIAMIDAQGRTTRVNDAVRKMWGGSAPHSESVEDFRAYKGWWPDSGMPLEPEDWPPARVLGSGAAVRDQMIDIERHDGARGTLVASGVPLRDEQGRVTGAVIVSEDISQRRRAEEALRQSEEKHRSLFENNLDAILLTIPDGKTIVDANPAACALFGMTKEELCCAGSAGIMEATPAAGEAIAEPRSGQIRRELKYVRKDGTGFAGEVSAVVLKPATDSPRSFVIIRDLTERRKAEAALRKSEHRLAEAQRIAHIGSWEWNTKSGEVRWSPELYSIYSVDPKTFAPTIASFADFIHPEDRPLVEKVIGEVVSGGKRVSFDFRIIAANGTLRTLNVIGEAAEFDEDGKPRLVLGVNQDITERKHAEEALQDANARLEEADRNKNHFLAMLSHELRNPLAPMRNSLYILDRAVPGGEQARRAQAVIDRQVGHMARLVDDLLDVTRLSRGKIQLQREAADLREVVRRTVEDFRPSFEAAGVEFELRMAQEALPAQVDRTRISQVVGNLLHNAAKFTPRGGRAWVSLERDTADDAAVIRVRDDGAGISAEMLARLFLPFSQADSTLDRSKGGLGLGLSLVKGLAEMHGGSVSAKSDGANKGSEFTVRLPLETAARSNLASNAARAAVLQRRVLIIEDNKDAAESLKEVLELDCHVVETAHSGPEGLAKAKRFAPHVVLCDIGLPGMDGYSVARAFRADPDLRTVFLVALSGYARSDDLAAAQAAGFDRHLAKPPSIASVEELIRASGVASDEAR